MNRSWFDVLMMNPIALILAIAGFSLIFSYLPLFFVGLKVRNYFHAGYTLGGNLKISRNGRKVIFSIPNPASRFGGQVLPLLRIGMDSPLCFQISIKDLPQPNREYMPHKGQLKIGESLLFVETNDEAFLKWLQSGELNSPLYLALSQGPSDLSIARSFRLDKIGLVIGNRSFPRGASAELALPQNIDHEPHLLEKYIDTFLELLDKVEAWRRMRAEST
jgi:hypothetical protein